MHPDADMVYEENQQRSARPNRKPRRMGRYILPPDELVAMETKENKALQMVQAGMDYDGIAQALGYGNRSGAWKAVRRALKRQPMEDAADYRQIQNSRLDMLFRALLLQALGAPPSQQNPEGIPLSLETIDRIIKIEEFRSKLLGTQAPKEFQLGQRREKPLEAYDYDQGIGQLAQTSPDRLLPLGDASTYTDVDAPEFRGDDEME